MEQLSSIRKQNHTGAGPQNLKACARRRTQALNPLRGHTKQKQKQKPRTKNLYTAWNSLHPSSNTRLKLMHFC